MFPTNRDIFSLIIGGTNVLNFKEYLPICMFLLFGIVIFLFIFYYPVSITKVCRQTVFFKIKTINLLKSQITDFLDLFFRGSPYVNVVTFVKKIINYVDDWKAVENKIAKKYNFRNENLAILHFA